jgi:hypothetical protein
VCASLLSIGVPASELSVFSFTSKSHAEYPTPTAPAASRQNPAILAKENLEGDWGGGSIVSVENAVATFVGSNELASEAPVVMFVV